MTFFVVGTVEDVAGFALAGIDGVVCHTPDEAARAIATTDVEALIIVSNGLLARGWRSSGDRLCVVLPASGDAPASEASRS